MGDDRSRRDIGYEYMGDKECFVDTVNIDAAIGVIITSIPLYSSHWHYIIS